MFSIVQANSKIARLKIKRLYDLRAKLIKYQPNDLILLHKYDQETGTAKSYQPLHHTTPFRVIEKLSDVNFLIENTENKERKVIHHDQITPYVERDNIRHSDRQVNPPAHLGDYVT